MTTINPYLNFNGNAKEAMGFYKDCFGGELMVQTVGESPMAKDMPANTHGNVMHATLMKEGTILLMGADSMKPDNYKIGNAVIISVNFTSEDEIKSIFEKLSAGGSVTMPLADQFWVALFGMLTDKFGHHWMMNHDKKK